MSDSRQDLSFGGPEYCRIVKKSGGLLYTTYVNRNLAWACSRVLKGFTPNQISIGAFFLLFLALPLAYFSDGFGMSFAAYLVLVLNYVLDSSDGQVSRLRNMGSPLGEWVDHSLDGVRILLIHSTLLLILIAAEVSNVYVLLCFLNIVFAASLFFTTELAGKILKKQVQKSVSDEWSLRRLIRSVVLLPADHGVFILIFLVAHRPSLLANVYVGYGVFWVCLFAGYALMTFMANRRVE